MTLGRTVSSFIWTVIGLIFISALPTLFNGVTLNFQGFFQQIWILIQQGIHPWSIDYINPTSGIKRHLFPDFFIPYFYSLLLVFGAFFNSIVLSILASTVLIFFKKKVISRFKGLLFVLESLPDIFVILTLQFLLVLIYQKTGVLLMKFVQFGTERIYMLPILVMSILPSVYFTKIMLINLEEQLGELYIDLAKSKGLSKPKIIYVHVLRNTLISAFFHSKSIIWILVSNLFIVEYFYNVNGITWFILNYYKPIILTIGLILLFVPIFIFQTGLQILIERATGEKGDEFD
jgi:ABC-type dipeptide/oligopeptide/nickel transport system permease component